MRSIYPIYRIWLATLFVVCAITALPGLAAAQGTPQGLSWAQSLQLWVPFSVVPLPGMPVKATPVIIVEDTLTIDLTYLPLELRLAQEGYIVQGFPLPLLGGAEIHNDAVALGRVVDALLSSTGAKQVHFIGHGQGAIVARTYIHDNQNANKVETMISLAAPHKGTKIVNGQAWEFFVPTLFGCYNGNALAIFQPPSCKELMIGSDLLAEINNNRPSNDPIYYTNVSTMNDAWIIPAENARMDCGTATASNGQPLCTNLTFQDVCPNHPIDHLALELDDKVATLALKALKHLQIDKPALGCL